MKFGFIAGFGPIVRDGARLLSPEGLIVGISYTPWMHGAGGDNSAPQ